MNLEFLTGFLTTAARRTREYANKLWVRVLAMGLLALVALALTQLIETLVPTELGARLSGSAADRLLELIANGMLAVTIFSITIMVTVHRSSSAQWTPRVHRLILQDRTTQNTLAVFIGAYVYGLVATILRELHVFVDDRALVLFCMTAFVLTGVVVYLIRWVLHLQTFGSLTSTARELEKTTGAQFKRYLANPCSGAKALGDDVPDEAIAIDAEESGYIQFLYPEALEEIAADHGVDLYLTKPVGQFVFAGEPLLMAVRTSKPKSESRDFSSLKQAVRRNVIQGDARLFEQDLRFGLIVMGEVASKALSPGINDPGTAIDMITRIGRILSLKPDEAHEPSTKLTRIHIAPLSPESLLTAGFAALSRDGKAVVEVQQSLQMVLTGLMQNPNAGLRRAARNAAETHLRRALQATEFASDQELLLQAAAPEVRGAVQNDS